MPIHIFQQAAFLKYESWLWFMVAWDVGGLFVMFVANQQPESSVMAAGWSQPQLDADPSCKVTNILPMPQGLSN